jgi:hypothetical protein
MVWIALGILAGLFLALFAATWWQIRRRNMQRWLPTYFREQERYQKPRPDEEIHVILCMADHYEPKAGGADLQTGRARVAAWVQRFPDQFSRFKDADGRSPRYTFFYPAEEYEKEYLDALAQLCRAGFGEVELHLHHDKDTPEGFRAKLLEFKEMLATQHGLLSRHKETGAIGYAFIHGNWALCNSRPDGAWCGVNNEIAILLETGCYADFTFPSAPDITQPPIINRIYHASDRPGMTRSHELPVEAGPNTLLMVQGPLLLDWKKKKWGIFPGIENACLQGSQPPSVERLVQWLQARIQVPQRPDWFFVKLHAHGAPEHDHEALLGAPMVKFHDDLAAVARENPKFHFHYVTAREMVNLIKAAEAGYTGPVTGALDWEWLSRIGQVPSTQYPVPST